MPHRPTGRRRPLQLLGRLLGTRRRLKPAPDLHAFASRPPDGVLVGGAVRDALLGRTATDLDWLVPDPPAAAVALAAATGGHPFPLDQKRGHWRVVAGAVTHDLVPLEGDLESDLRRRDFTVNALALTGSGLMDPLGGAADLRAGILRACSETALRDDPLRGLRGVRLAWALDLRWERATRRQAEAVTRELAAATGASLPAAERRRDELHALLFGPRPGDALMDAHRLGWLELLIPELVAGDGVPQGALHHLDVLRHGLEALQRLASGFPDADLALRLGTLLHDVAKPECREIGPLGRPRFHGHAERGAERTREALTRLRFDARTVRRASALVRWHMLPLPSDERAARRFVHRRRPLLPDLLRLMIADREAARGPLSSEATRRGYRLALARVVAILEEEPEPPPLLDGREVMELLELPPGPRVGEALAFVKEARAVGDVHDRSDAVRALRAFARAQGWADGSREPS